MTIGERIKIIRKGGGLNQIEFANRISVSQGRLSEIESGVAMPSVETIKLIIKEFSCDVNWLLDISEVHLSNWKYSNLDLTVEENELLLFFRSLNSINQKETLDILKTKLKGKY